MKKHNNFQGLNNCILQILFKLNLCSICIEKICNDSLECTLKLNITSSKKNLQCYLHFLKEKILNIPIDCANKSIGCEEIIMLGDTQEHLSECQYRKNSNEITDLSNLINFNDESNEFNNESDKIDNFKITSSGSSIVPNKIKKKIVKK